MNEATNEQTTRTAFDTWKAIAAVVGRSERWCRYMTLRSSDPLPVFKVGGMVRLNLCDLDAWLERQRTTARVSRARPAAGGDLAAENARLRAEIAELKRTMPDGDGREIARRP